MLPGFFLKLLLEGLHVVLKLPPLVFVDLVDVSCACVVDALTKHPSPIQPNYALLQVLVAQVILEEHLLDIVLELTDRLLLPIDLVFHLAAGLCEAFLTHPQIVDDEHQVLVDSIEVLLLRPHFVCLLVQFLDLNFLGANVSLQFFDLVIENELKLLKLLDLLLELLDLDVFLLDCGNTGLVVLLESCNV